MKKRETASTAAYPSKISNKGTLPQFVFCGYVQLVHTGKNEKYPVDYCRFAVKPDGRHTDPDEPPVIFAVTVPHALGWQLEAGDAVVIKGHVASWKKQDEIYKTWYRLELVADSVQEWDGLFKSERKAVKPEGVEPFERRGHVLYPPGTAPAPKEEEPDFSEASAEELAAFEAGVIAGNPPF